MIVLQLIHLGPLSQMQGHSNHHLIDEQNATTDRPLKGRAGVLEYCLETDTRARATRAERLIARATCPELGCQVSSFQG